MEPTLPTLPKSWQKRGAPVQQVGPLKTRVPPIPE